jgi:DNA-binding transcriptional MerR regulator
MGLNIKAVAELTGVPLHTLRAWERRYGIPRPDRNAENRYRLYDDQDIADVLWMKRQVEAGVSPAQASAMLRQTQRGTLLAPAPTLAPTPIQAHVNALYDAAVALDEAAMQRVLNQVWSTFAPEQVIVDVLQPTLRRIGDSWQRNLLSVEQEHFASNLIRQRLHAMIQAHITPPLTAPRLVAACAPEEQHDIGLLMLTYLAKQHGWNVTYLGQRTPLDELNKASAHARYIVLSVTTVTGLASLLPLWVEKLPHAPILFGGEIFNVAPRLREHVPGAYLGEDAVAAMRNLTTRAPRMLEWKPDATQLDAAFELQALRLQVTADAVTHFMGRLKAKTDTYDESRATMTQAALFLTDMVSCALAFDIPELMDVEGMWLYDLLTPRQVPAPVLHQFLNLYGASAKRFLSKASAKMIHALVMRFDAAAQAQSASVRAA